MSSHSRFWPRWLLSEAMPARPAVEPGAIFEAVNERQTVEVAEIIGTRTDGLGVGHVRFRLSYRTSTARWMPANARWRWRLF
jgi:hypothetical protein